MPRKAPELTDVAVRKITGAGLHAVGGVPGLYLQVKTTGARSWVLRAIIGRKRRDMGLGGYPAVSLKDARETARRAQEAIREGRDPIGERKTARQGLMASAAALTTFKQAAEAYLAAHAPGWANPKHRQQWSATLSTYAYPVIGPLAVGDVQLAHVLKILEPIWTTKTETAKRLRGRIEQVLDAAHTRGQIADPWQNPARWRGRLDKILPRPSKVAKVEHHRALPIDEAPAFMARLAAEQGMGAKALRFAILTAARSGEVRGATWDEIDLERGVWTLPANRMKARKEHRVPLSGAALDLLRGLPRMGGDPTVFAASRGGALSDMTLSAVLVRMRVEAVPHGFRSTFRDWASERTAYPSDVCEMALAHTVASKVEAAYRRGDLFDRRRRLMEDWATFLTVPVRAGAVTPFRREA